MKYITSIGALSILFLLFTAFTADPGSTKDEESIQWMSIEEAIAKADKEPKKIIIDIYTDWCGWCKKLDKNTFGNPVVAKYINDNYYPVKLDGEMKETIIMNGQEFKFINKGRRGVHELANYLMAGKPSYPSVAFLSAEREVITVQPGYLEPDVMDKLIRYIGDDYYLKTPWPMFEKTYRSKVKSKKRK